MRLINFLNEEIYKGKFYMSLNFPLDVKNIRFYKYLYDYNGSGAMDVTTIPLNSTLLTRYKTTLSAVSSSTPTHNYIYEIDNIRILQMFNDKEINKALELKILRKEFSLEEYKKTDYKDNYLIDFINKDIFFKYYDGYINKKNGDCYLIITKNSKIFDKFKLVDGNSIRFEKNSSIEFEFPEYIKDELVRYTNDAKKKLKSDVKDWLIKNSPKPYTTKKVYRTVGIQFDDYGDFSKQSISNIEKMLKKYFNIKKLDDIKLYGEAELKRGKESSWSTDPIISRTFAKGLAEKSLNILFETNAKSDNIIIDFTELSTSMSKIFKYKSQNEVILDKGTIKSKIIGLWAEKPFIEWLNQNGYDFKANKGIYK